MSDTFQQSETPPREPRRAEWVKPEVRRMRSGGAKGNGGAGVDFASETS